MTATQTTPTPQSLVVLDPNRAQDHWLEVHKAGCAHLRRGRKGEGSSPLEASSLEEAAQELGSDFIAEGSMTLQDCLEQVYFAPCVKLPQSLEEAPTPRKGRGKRAPLALVPDPTPAEEAPAVKAPRKALPNSERRTEATHADGGSAVSHGKCPQCGSRKGAVCTSKLGAPTNMVHAPRFQAWVAAGSPVLPMPAPARKRGGVWVVVK